MNNVKESAIVGASAQRERTSPRTTKLPSNLPPGTALDDLRSAYADVLLQAASIIKDEHHPRNEYALALLGLQEEVARLLAELVDEL